MSEIPFLILGLLLGILVGWHWTISRARSSLVGQVAEVKQRGARAVEHLRDELHQQMERREHELVDLRSKLEEERQVAATTQARFQHLQDEKKRIEKTALELTETMNALSSDLSATINQDLLDVTQFQDFGKYLEDFVETYERAVESMESRVRAAAGRLKELQASSGGEASPVESVDQAPESDISSLEQDREDKSRRKVSGRER